MDIQLPDLVSICNFPYYVLVYYPKMDPIHEGVHRIDQWCMENMEKSLVIHLPGKRAMGELPNDLRA